MYRTKATLTLNKFVKPVPKLTTNACFITRERAVIKLKLKHFKPIKAVQDLVAVKYTL